MTEHLTPMISLREITADTVEAVIDLTVADDQQDYVASNAVSLAQALFAPEAWYRAIYWGEELVGFVMLDDETQLDPPPEKPGISLWRFMIDARHQGRGIGREAVLAIIETVRQRGVFDALELSYVPGPKNPEMFYRSLGFEHTGRMEDDEIILRLPLTTA